MPATKLIRLTVITLNNKQIQFQVKTNETIDQIKAIIQQKIGMSKDKQHLVCHDKSLEPSTHTLGQYLISYQVRYQI